MILKNSHVRIVFSPKNRELFEGKRRFAISVNKLASYIGSKNAETCQSAHFRNKTNKCTCRFRKCGKIEIYDK
jgi:hypothetical protein